MQCPFPGWTAEVSFCYFPETLQILKMLADAQHLRIQPVIVDNEIGSLNWGTLLVSLFHGSKASSIRITGLGLEP